MKYMAVTGDSQDVLPEACCAYCGGEIYRGERVYAGARGMVHAECILEFLLDDAGIDIMAEELGYDPVRAGDLDDAV